MRKPVLFRKRKSKAIGSRKKGKGAFYKAAAFWLAAGITGSAFLPAQAKEEQTALEEQVISEEGSMPGTQTVSYVYHRHIGSKEAEGGCYRRPVYHSHEGNETEGGPCFETPSYHSHSGNETEGGPCYGTAVYHTHQGDESQGGECYSPVYHVHTDSCYRTVSSSEYGCYTVKVVDTGDGDYEGHDYKYYYMSCGMTVHGTNSSHTHSKLECGRGGEVTGFSLSCKKTGESVDSYLLDCKRTEESIDGYLLSCERTEKDIESYERSCGKEETTACGTIILSEEKREGGKKAQLYAAFEDLTGGELILSETPFTWYDNAGNEIGKGEYALISENGAYSIKLGITNEDVNPDSLTARIRVTDLVKPAPAPSGDKGEEKEEGGGEEETGTPAPEEQETDTPVPEKQEAEPAPSEIPFPSEMPVTEETVKKQENKEQQKGSPAPALKKHTITVKAKEQKSGKIDFLPVQSVKERKGFLPSAAAKVLILTAGTLLLLTGLAALVYFRFHSVAVYNDDGEGGMIFLGRRTVLREEEEYLLEITCAMEERAVTNRYCIRPGLFAALKAEGTELIVEKGKDRISAALKKEMILVF